MLLNLTLVPSVHQYSYPSSIREVDGGPSFHPPVSLTTPTPHHTSQGPSVASRHFSQFLRFSHSWKQGEINLKNLFYLIPNSTSNFCVPWFYKLSKNLIVACFFYSSSIGFSDPPTQWGWSHSSWNGLWFLCFHSKIVIWYICPASPVWSWSGFLFILPVLLGRMIKACLGKP